MGRKKHYNDKKYKKPRKCPCGNRLNSTQSTYCSRACRMNIFYGVPQNRPTFIEHTFDGCGHTRIISRRYLMREVYGKYCSRECYPRHNFDGVSCYKNYNIYSGRNKTINILDGIASDIETRQLVRYKQNERGKYEKVERRI
jgi:hypothetical protein